MKKYLSGLKFGMLLQLAIGPMCLIVFNTAKNSSFLLAFTLVLVITLVDAFYIILAGLGVSKLCIGKDIDEVIELLSDIPCGFRNTSCPDQLSKALTILKETK